MSKTSGELIDYYTYAEAMDQVASLEGECANLIREKRELEAKIEAMKESGGCMAMAIELMRGSCQLTDDWSDAVYGDHSRTRWGITK